MTTRYKPSKTTSEFLLSTWARSTPFRFLIRVLALLIWLQAIAPPAAMALTAGPSQPEVQGFQAIGNGDMVDLFTGDFQYNIPLLDVDGYPINIAYASNPTIDQEASWVGLGWSLNPGAINRNVRGLPDDFKEEPIEKAYHIKPDRTVGVSLGPGFEFFGFFGLSASLGVYSNTYTGYGIEVGLTPAIKVGKGQGQDTEGFGANFELGLSYASQAGINVMPQLGLSNRGKNTFNQFFGIGAGFNSIRGLKSLTLGASLSSGKLASKTKGALSEGRLGLNFSFGDFTYFPSASMPMTNSGFTFRQKVGGELFGGLTHVEVSGYVSAQELLSKTQTQPSFGYLYSAESEAFPEALQDFNREKELPFRERNPILPMTHGTYDLFSTTGQGISGQFRIMRNDVGLFRGAKTRNGGQSNSLGVEIGIGNAFHAGADIMTSINEVQSGAWLDNNLMQPRVAFTKSHNLYEANFFKHSGERLITDTLFFERIGGADPVRVNLKRTGMNGQAQSVLNKSTGSSKQETTLAVNGPLHRSKTSREKRKQVMSYLTAAEASIGALDIQIESYPATSTLVGTCSEDLITKTNRVDGVRKAHHISEITITQPNGNRYIYGIPVYNTAHREVNFNVGDPILPAETLVNYLEGQDNSTNNQQGVDQYFEAQEIPPYAHAYLLTAILTPDYVDRTGDGISDDDTGDATAFHYTRLHTDYQWRTPYQHARYSEGSKAKTGSIADDKGSYVYGKKEIWYLHSIETRTMLARFHTSDRLDGRQVLNEDGGQSSDNLLQKLDRVDLFSKSELLESQNLGTTPLPIKSVHFEYTNELCRKTANNVHVNSIPLFNESGKLTLKKIFFTYQNSNRGALNAYHFQYARRNGGSFPPYNPNYNVDQYDRWGYYKNPPQSGQSSNANYPLWADFPSKSDFPYVLQEKTVADDQSGVWNLSEIELPSGAKIQIEYESDDYAYIQDRRAGQMHFLTGFTSTPQGSLSESLYDENSLEPNQYLVFNLVTPMTTLDLEAFKRRYLEDVEKIYFHCLVNLDGAVKEDVIKGYVEFNSNDIHFRDGGQAVAIGLKNLPQVKNQDYHPITFSTLQNLRLYYPEIIFPGYNTDGSVSQAVLKLAGVGTEIKRLFKGFSKSSIKKGWGRTVDLHNSWIRLANPTFHKLGGGSRVKKITVSDEWGTWNQRPGDGTSTYGQEYSYEKTTTINGELVPISSGVASYEPFIGNEENPFRQPLPYEAQQTATVAASHFIELPVGESLFPSPIVGYSQVKVTPFGTYANQTAYDLGYAEHEFYTAYDFPLRTAYTNIQSAKARTGPLGQFFRISVKDHFAASQGFVVELNDMHGKPKRMASYDRNGNEIASTLYKYLVEEATDGAPTLKNEVEVVYPDGSISKANIGLEVDMWQDMREESNITMAQGVKTNVDGFLAFIIPFIATIPFPTANQSSKKLRTAVTTKLIKRIGLLDEVIVMENGSQLTTKNLLYDSETGDVLLSRTENEFNDAIYQLSYPAHWAYEGMGPAYQNIGATFSNVDVDNGKIMAPFEFSQITPGDEFLVEKRLIDGTYELLPERYTLVQTRHTPAVFSLLDPYGNALEPVGMPDDFYRLKIVRSGRRNLLSNTIEKFTTRQLPVNSSATSLEVDPMKEILECNAQEFSEIWTIPCSYIENCGELSLIEQAINPYQEGALGNWRSQQNYRYHQARNSVNLVQGVNDSTSIQRIGSFEAFSPLWQFNATSQQWESYPIPDWVPAQKVTVYDRRGNELENLDAIGNHAAAQFAFKQTKVTAMASNARAPEIYIDGFEDEAYENACVTSTISTFSLYQPSEVSLSDQVSHTGKYALVLPPLGETKQLIPIESCLINSPTGTVRSPIHHLATDDTYTQMYNTCETCQVDFKPLPGATYFVNTWVATQTSIDCGQAPSQAALSVYFDTESDLITLRPEGPIIDGWQRIAGLWTVPANAQTLHLALFNDSSEALYLDDFRIHPKNAHVVSYVYDPQSLRLMAQLDDNNYAQFYEYNDEGLLVRTKRETEKGIVTLQENRTAFRVNNP